MNNMDDVTERTFPILDAINDTLRGRQLTSRRVTSPIVTSSLAGANCRIVSARDIRCGRGLSPAAAAAAVPRDFHDVTVTSRSPGPGCVVNGNGTQRRVGGDDAVLNCSGHVSSANDDDCAGDDDNFECDAMSMPWDMMSRWCRYAALSSLLTLW